MDNKKVAQELVELANSLTQERTAGGFMTMARFVENDEGYAARIQVKFSDIPMKQLNKKLNDVESAFHRLVMKFNWEGDMTKAWSTGQNHVYAIFNFDSGDEEGTYMEDAERFISKLNKVIKS